MLDRCFGEEVTIGIYARAPVLPDSRTATVIQTSTGGLLQVIPYWGKGDRCKPIRVDIPPPPSPPFHGFKRSILHTSVDASTCMRRGRPRLLERSSNRDIQASSMAKS